MLISKVSNVKGKVVLGRYDENTKPTSFSRSRSKLENGQAVISLQLEVLRAKY